MAVVIKYEGESLTQSVMLAEFFCGKATRVKYKSVCCLCLCVRVKGVSLVGR